MTVSHSPAVFSCQSEVLKDFSIILETEVGVVGLHGSNEVLHQEVIGQGESRNINNGEHYDLKPSKATSFCQEVRKLHPCLQLINPILLDQLFLPCATQAYLQA